jgi:hypothetical protein
MKNQNQKKVKPNFFGEVATDKFGTKFRVGLGANSPDDFGRILTTYDYCMFNGTVFRTIDLQKKVLQAPILLTKFADCYKIEKI